MSFDTQYSLTGVLRPFNGFEALYQGQSTARPIAMPGTLDLNAGKTGYDPNLLAGLPVPLGARVLLWFPLTFSSDAEGPVPSTLYRYQLIWRMRSIEDHNDSVAANLLQPNQIPYHMPRRDLGVPNVEGQPASALYVIPAAMESVAYEQAEPGSDFANGSVNLRGQFIVPDAGVVLNGPFLPPPATGLGSAEQGAFVGGAGGTAFGGPGFVPYVTDAMGDELIIYVTRAILTDDPTWDFTDNDEDKGFSNVYGTDNGGHPNNPNIGVFVLTGNN